MAPAKISKVNFPELELSSLSLGLVDQKGELI